MRASTYKIDGRKFTGLYNPLALYLVSKALRGDRQAKEIVDSIFEDEGVNEIYDDNGDIYYPPAETPDDQDGGAVDNPRYYAGDPHCGGWGGGSR